MEREKLNFYGLVERSLRQLPPELSGLLDNVAIVVDDSWPDLFSMLLAPAETWAMASTEVPLSRSGAGYYG